jgi:GH24 family phage-related lysozyme (muramidase)
MVNALSLFLAPCRRLYRITEPARMSLSDEDLISQLIPWFSSSGHEGVVPHMYLDKKGLVTVGVGHLLKSEASTANLRFFKSDGTPASNQDKVKDWNRVSKGGQAELQFNDSMSLLRSDIRTALTAAKDKFSDWDQLPDIVQKVLVDMQFDGSLTTFKRFIAAIKARDWHRAGIESHRSNVPAGLNQKIRDILFQLATDAGHYEDPDRQISRDPLDVTGPRASDINDGNFV